MMNILVTGANGQLGSEMQVLSGRKSAAYGVVAEAISGLPADARFFFSDVAGCSGQAGESAGEPEIHYLDITNAEAVNAFVTEHNINCIVNCAGYTNVEGAEDNQAAAELLNATAVENLALAMKQAGGLLVHISTDYVFGGSSYNTPRGEDEPENPTGVYGVTKLHGEQAIKMVGGNYVIIRTAWMYSEYGKNFLKTMLALTASKPEIKVVFDQVGTPTYARDLAEAIMKILSDFEASKTGTYHYSNEGVCSWYDFAKMIAQYSGQTACRVQPCHSNEFPSKVVRPSYSVLDKTKIKETFGVEIPYWTDSLKCCIANLKSDKVE